MTIIFPYERDLNDEDSNFSRIGLLCAVACGDDDKTTSDGAGGAGGGRKAVQVERVAVAVQAVVRRSGRLCRSVDR